MAWVRIDDLMPEHPKMIEAGPLGLAMFVAGLAYCNRHLTDGVIPARVVPRLQDIDEPMLVAERLVNAGLWYQDGDAYRVHDYLTYQPSKAKVTGERSKAADRMRRSRTRA